MIVKNVYTEADRVYELLKEFRSHYGPAVDPQCGTDEFLLRVDSLIREIDGE